MNCNFLSVKWDSNPNFSDLLWEKNVIIHWISDLLSLSRHLINAHLFQLRFIRREHLASPVREVHEKIVWLFNTPIGTYTFKQELWEATCRGQWWCPYSQHLQNSTLELPSEYILPYSHILWLRLFSIYSAGSLTFSSGLHLHNVVVLKVQFDFERLSYLKNMMQDLKATLKEKLPKCCDSRQLTWLLNYWPDSPRSQ